MISRKGGNALIGIDNIKKSNQKLYLILVSENSGKSLLRETKFYAEKNRCEIILINEDDFKKLTKTDNCKTVAITNEGLSEEINKIIKEVQIGS